MFLGRQHRNSQKRFYGKDKIYFITTVTRKRFSFFKEDMFCELVVENLRICKKLKEFKLYAFTIIWDHIHLLLKPDGKFDISQIIHNLKRTSSLQTNQIMNLHNEGENIYSRLHLNNKIDDLNKKFIKKYGRSQYQIPLFKWQQSFYDHVIRNEKDFTKHLNYINYNCVKHGICENEMKYKWSSINPEFSGLVDDWQ